MGSIPWVTQTLRRPKARTRRDPTLVALLLFLALALALKLSVATVVVDGTSMNPTLHPGQYLVVSRLYTRPRAGDLVVVDRWMNNRPLVKRIYRTEGEGVEWQQAPSYLSAPERLHFVVPKGSVYLLGDNAPASEDSRYYGPVPVDRIVGKVIASPGHPTPK